MNEKYLPIAITSDDNGHEYIVPIELAQEFHKTLEQCTEDDDYDAMDKFDKYRTGRSVDNYQLFISESELKKLIGESR